MRVIYGPPLGADTHFGKTVGRNRELRRLGKVSAAPDKRLPLGGKKGPGLRKMVTVES